MRTQIRDAIEAELENIDCLTVSTSRFRRWSDSELPAVNLLANEEELVEDSVSHGYRGVMALSVTLEVIIKENDDFDEAFDRILNQVLEALRQSRNTGQLSDIALNSHYTGSSDPEYSNESDEDLFKQTINYMVMYERDI